MAQISNFDFTIFLRKFLFFRDAEVKVKCPRTHLLLDIFAAEIHPFDAVIMLLFVNVLRLELSNQLLRYKLYQKNYFTRNDVSFY